MKTIKTSRISKSPCLANINIYHLVGQERPIRVRSFFSIELNPPNVTQTKLTIDKIFTFKIVRVVRRPFSVCCYLNDNTSNKASFFVYNTTLSVCCSIYRQAVAFLEEGEGWIRKLRLNLSFPLSGPLRW